VAVSAKEALASTRDELHSLREAWNDTSAVEVGTIDSLSMGMVDLKVVMLLPANPPEDLPTNLAWLSKGVPTMVKGTRAFVGVSA
jgi:hypothetical protein